MQANFTIGVTRFVHVIIAGAIEFVYCCEIILEERDYSMIFSLGEETSAYKVSPVLRR